MLWPMKTQWIGITFTRDVDKAQFLNLMTGCWTAVAAAGLASVATIWQDGTLTDDDLNAGFAVMFEYCPWADGPPATIEQPAARQSP
jgi:hypothetical protein